MLILSTDDLGFLEKMVKAGNSMVGIDSKSSKQKMTRNIYYVFTTVCQMQNQGASNGQDQCRARCIVHTCSPSYLGD